MAYGDLVQWMDDETYRQVKLRAYDICSSKGHENPFIWHEECWVEAMKQIGIEKP